MDRGLPIRSISRCIAVLQAINRQGSLSLMQIARMSRLPYPTACRIIQTLMHEGLVECEPTRKWYRATELVHSLSRGFDNQDRLVTSARPFIVALTREVGWPVVIATRVGLSMMVRDTTHDLTALTTNLHPPGFTMPLLESASGLAYVAHLDDDDRKGLIEALERAGPRSPSLSTFESDGPIARIREDGYAVYERVPDAADPEKTSSISVPLHDDTGLAGSLTLVFFSSMMEMTEAIERYVVVLKATARAIGEANGSPSRGGRFAGGELPQGHGQAPSKQAASTSV